jgi:hypothetical protein
VRFFLIHNSDNRIRALNDVFFGCRPRGYAYPHGGLIPPHGSSAPAGPILLNSLDDAVRKIRIAERYQYLIQNDVVDDFNARFFQPPGEELREPTISVDQIPQAVFP